MVLPKYFLTLYNKTKTTKKKEKVRGKKLVKLQQKFEPIVNECLILNNSSWIENNFIPPKQCNLDFRNMFIKLLAPQI